MSVTGTTKLWNINELTNSPYAVLILNQPIKIEIQTFVELWNKSSISVSADGGTNQLFDFSQTTEAHLKHPHLITGDFDSIRPEVQDFYAEKGSRLIHTPDQNYTDFTKAVHEIITVITSNSIKVEKILVICEPSGRVDQFFANVSTLCKFSTNSSIELFLISVESISWVLPQNIKHSIVTNEVYVSSKAYCGLIPLDGITKIKTKGLKWDLTEEMTCSMNGLVSTSNEVVNTIVEVESDKDVLWTTKSII